MFIYCRGRWIVLLSLFCFSLFCTGMPVFARNFGDLWNVWFRWHLGKIEQDEASCCGLLVVKIVLKGKYLLLRIIKKFFRDIFYILIHSHMDTFHLGISFPFFFPLLEIQLAKVSLPLIKVQVPLIYKDIPK